MSQVTVQQIGSFKAGATISAYRLVGPHTTTAERTVAQWATATSIILGVSTDDYNSDAAAAIVVGGSAKAQCGASVTMWTPATGQTDTGKIIDSSSLAATAASLVIPFLAGVPLENGSTDGIVELLVRPSNVRFDF